MVKKSIERLFPAYIFHVKMMVKFFTITPNLPKSFQVAALEKKMDSDR